VLHLAPSSVAPFHTLGADFRTAKLRCGILCREHRF